MTEGSDDRAIKILATAANELAAIHRGKHYAQWREGAVARLAQDLGRLPHFAPFMRLWIHTGDGSGRTGTPRLGEWAVDRLVERTEPAAIIAAFDAEAARNVGHYSDVSVVYGVTLDSPCDLGDGVTITPEPPEVIAALWQRGMLQRGFVATGTTLLRQAFTVTPAYVLPADEGLPQGGHNVTTPSSTDRESVRQRVRLACLLAGPGGAEIPETQLQPDRGAAIVSGAGNSMGRMYAAMPHFNIPVMADAVRQAYDLLGGFQDLESLTRAIERLGRSRVATHLVDRFLELGMAAEIALMHDNSISNTEIAQKISGRAAWLLGRGPEDREAIFDNMKKLYAARSTSVHAGRLSSKPAISLEDADELVRRVLVGILARGKFPNWNNLTLGGDG